MKSRMSSWASFFTRGGMSPSTCGVGTHTGAGLWEDSLSPEQDLVLTPPFPSWAAWRAQGLPLGPPLTSLHLRFFMWE